MYLEHHLSDLLNCNRLLDGGMYQRTLIFATNKKPNMYKLPESILKDFSEKIMVNSGIGYSLYKLYKL